MVRSIFINETISYAGFYESAVDPAAFKVRDHDIIIVISFRQEQLGLSSLRGRRGCRHRFLIRLLSQNDLHGLSERNASYLREVIEC